MPRTEPKATENTSAGRKRNDAQPLGERDGLVPKRKAAAIADDERRSAGPDGPDARAVGDTFKAAPLARPTAPD